mmetsp:Transcript_40409/g.45547  ORF Transcript_40409/g.45547 Transcript_40409/m.45547 type:complete len:100 (-) Transcript_40409:37-336(-)
MYQMNRNVDVMSRYSSFEIAFVLRYKLFLHHLPQIYHITIHITVISISIHTNTNTNTNINIGMNREKNWLESWPYVVLGGPREGGNVNDNDGIRREVFL